jgi:hypothetical protein
VTNGNKTPALEKKPSRKKQPLTKEQKSEALLQALVKNNWDKARNYTRTGVRLKLEGVSGVWLFELMREIVMAHDAERLSILIEAGAPIESEVGSDGQTLLMFAAEYSAVDCVEYLLNVGADVFAKDHTGQGLLNHASSWHYERSPHLIDQTIELLEAAQKDPHRCQKQSRRS